MKPPKTEQTEPATDQHDTILSVTGTGQALLVDQPVTLEKLETELKALQTKDPEVSLNCKLTAEQSLMPSRKYWPVPSVPL